MKLAFQIIGILFASVAILIVFCNQYTAWYARNYLYDTTSSIPANKVGVILGTSKKLGDGRRNMYFYNRIDAAVELYKAGKIQYILVSGDNATRYYNEPKDMKNALLNRNVPDSAIYMDRAGFSTFDSMIRSRKVFGQDRITIISQKFHNERAVFIAREKGIDAVGYNAEDVDAYNGFKTRVRELLARVKVFLDLYILNQSPKKLGPGINIP